MTSSPHSIKFNFIMNAALSVSTFLYPLITYPYVTRGLGAEYYGKVIFASYVANWVSMFSQLGIPTYGIRACAACRNDEAKLRKTVKEILTLNVVTALLVYGAFLLCILLVPRFREDPLLFLIVSVPVLLNAVGADWFFKGLEEYGYVAFRDTLFRVIAIVLLFLLVHTELDYRYYALTIAVAGGGPAILNFLNARKRLGGFRGEQRTDWKRHFRPVLTFFMLTVAISIYTNMDVVMLGFLSADAQVGYYGAATRMKGIAVSFVTALGGVLMPRVSNYLAEGKKEAFRKLVTGNFAFVFLIAAPMTFYCMAMADQVILFLSGDKFRGAMLPMRFISITILLIGLSNVTGMQILVPSGRERMTTISTVWGACLNLIVNFALIPRMGAMGAVIGTVLAELVVLAVQIWYLKGELGLYLKELELGKILAANAAACAALAVIRNLLQMNAPASVLIYGMRILLSGLVFCGIYLGLLAAEREKTTLAFFGKLRG